jgi:uncharacterized protein YbjT (DUF2867 family)
MPPILVTGSTSTLGWHVTQKLTERGANAAAATRRPGATGVDLSPPTVRFDLEDPSAYGAFCGERVFLVRPPVMARVYESIFPAIDAAGRSGGTHVAFLSLPGAE